MKNKIENTIKEQLDQREITVSENAWEKLAQMMEEDSVSAPVVETKPQSNTRKLWIPIAIAASFVLLFGLFWKDFYPTSVSENYVQPIEQIVSKEKDVQIIQKANQNPVTEIAANDKDYYVDNSVASLPKNSSTPAKNLPQVEKESFIESNTTVELIKENSTLKEEIKIEMEPQSELALQKETVPETKKKTNYVDPDMLLYSIENNEAVKQTNSTSRIVLVDFNK